MENNIDIIKPEIIQDYILTIRGRVVIIDRDLAVLYGVKTKRINEQVKRNIERFPESFCFQLSQNEKSEVVAKCDHLKNLKFSPNLPYVFTEQGIAMLSSVLHSKTAIKISVQIMQTFVKMRQLINGNTGIFIRLENIEQKQIETDQKFNQIFKAIEDKGLKSKQGIFYDGQIFDAYKFINDIIRTAKYSIKLIDNYIDDTTLNILTKRTTNVKTIIYTKNISQVLIQDLKKHNSQYEHIEIKKLKVSHDRFLIIDEKIVYHIGASIKDLGKKWFAFSKMDIEIFEMINKLQLNTE